MIPEEKQSHPSVTASYLCKKCGTKLQNGFKISGKINVERWNFCPICGEEIEWDKVVPVDWSDLDCDTCGKPLIRNRGGIPYAMSDFIGTSTCRSCQLEYCRQTNCLACKDGNYPDCRFLKMKKEDNRICEI